jgi:hypothetical protein
MSATPKFPIYQKREFRCGNHHEEEYLMIAPNYRLRVSLVWEPKPNALLHVSHEAYDPGRATPVLRCLILIPIVWEKLVVRG